MLPLSGWTGSQRDGREAHMTVLDDVRRLIERLAPHPVCDDCIAERLGLSARQHANHKTRELAGTPGFERRIEACSLCNSTKTVIRKNVK
jgi:hypothetical protein